MDRTHAFVILLSTQGNHRFMVSKRIRGAQSPIECSYGHALQSGSIKAYVPMSTGIIDYFVI